MLQTVTHEVGERARDIFRNFFENRRLAPDFVEKTRIDIAILFPEELACHSMNIAAPHAATASKRSKISAPNPSANAPNARES